MHQSYQEIDCKYPDEKYFCFYLAFRENKEFGLLKEVALTISILASCIAKESI